VVPLGERGDGCGFAQQPDRVHRCQLLGLVVVIQQREQAVDHTGRDRGALSRSIEGRGKQPPGHSGGGNP